MPRDRAQARRAAVNARATWGLQLGRQAYRAGLPTGSIFSNALCDKVFCRLAGSVGVWVPFLPFVIDFLTEFLSCQPPELVSLLTHPEAFAAFFVCFAAEGDDASCGACGAAGGRVFVTRSVGLSKSWLRVISRWVDTLPHRRVLSGTAVVFFLLLECAGDSPTPRATAPHLLVRLVDAFPATGSPGSPSSATCSSSAKSSTLRATILCDGPGAVE